jgi:hypothetical protein
LTSLNNEYFTMKKQLAALLLSGAFLSVHAQVFELGARGGADSFWLFNSGVSNAGNSESKTLSFSYNAGFHVAWDITDNIGLETNALYASLNQTYSGSFSKTGLLPDGSAYVSGQSYTSKINMTGWQFPILGCFETNSGSFVELGVEYDMIQGSNYTGSFSNPSATRSFSTTSYFSNSNVLGVFGVGGKFGINDYIFILTDFRVTYGFKDIQGVDGLGQAYNSTPYYSQVNPTNTLTGSINVGVFYLLDAAPTTRVGHVCHGAPKVRSGTRHPS